MTNATFQQKFLDDFGALGNDELIAMMELMAKDSGAAMDNWILMLQNSIEEERKLLAYLESSTLTNSLIRYYDENSLKNILKTLEEGKKQKFLKDFGNVSIDWFNTLKTKPEAINRWDNLTENGKLIAKQKPESWLYVYDRLYENLPKALRLPNAEILQRFGQRGLDLVNEVENHALQFISMATKTQLLKRDVLISGMKDKITGISSSPFHNFSGKDFIKGGDYDIFTNAPISNTNACFPNLKRKIQDLINFKHPDNYRMTNSEYFKNSGKYPGAHAEIRALDDLAKKKFPNYQTNPPSDSVFDTWLKNDVLGYNRNIQYGAGQQDVIMHTCVDCFHILDLVTFVKP